ncbi:uncharacterized [Tachysurus ichikawai]
MLWGCGDIFFLDSLAHNKNRQLSPSHCHVKRSGVGVFFSSGTRGMGGFCLPCGFHGPALKIDHRNPLQAEKASSVTHVISLDTSSQCACKLEVFSKIEKVEPSKLCKSIWGGVLRAIPKRKSECKMTIHALQQDKLS